LPSSDVIEALSQKQSFNLGLVIVVLGFLLFLGAMIYYADAVAILDEKVGEFELRFSKAVDSLVAQKMQKERSEAQRDVVEGVFSVLKTPLSSIKSDVAMLAVVPDVFEVESKANDINKQIEKIEGFIAALRRSSNPGQVSPARSKPDEILKALLPDWEVAIKKYGAVVTYKLGFVHEISIPERDVRAIFRHVLQFSQERVSKNLYPKNVMVSLSVGESGIHFSLIDNMEIKESELEELRSNMSLAIAIGTLEANYCSMGLDMIPGGGLQISFDLVKTEDQTLDSLSAVSRRLDK
jgi:hypothetical protein